MYEKKKSDFIDFTGVWRGKTGTFRGGVTADKWAAFAKQIDQLFEGGAEKINVMFRDNSATKKKETNPDGSIFVAPHDPNWNKGGDEVPPTTRGFRR